MVVTLLGQVSTDKLISVLKRKSIIVIAMAALNGAAALLMVVQAFLSTRDAVQQHSVFVLKPLC